MTADDLLRPLGQEPPRRPWRRRTDVLAALACVFAIALAGLVGWVLLVDDPLGGEPSASSPIERVSGESGEREPAAARQTPGEGAVQEPAQELAQEPAMDLDEIAARTRIIDPETGEVDGPPLELEAEPVPARESVASLAPAPDPDLVEDSSFGPVPRISRDGRRPADVYARPVVAAAGGAGARIALVVTGLGLSEEASARAIEDLPGALTLAFSPYGQEVEALARRARGDGHETLVQVPMEPFAFPDDDPGPRALMTSLSPEQNGERLAWTLSRFAGFAGAISYMGARFTSSDGALQPFLEEMHGRGLYFVDEGASPRSRVEALAEPLGMSARTVRFRLEAGAGAEATAEFLADIEARARAQGQVLAVVPAAPAVLESLTRWADGLEGRDVALIPASAVMPRPGS